LVPNAPVTVGEIAPVASKRGVTGPAIAAGPRLPAASTAATPTQ
jgi:hypothetical protein